MSPFKPGSFPAFLYSQFLVTPTLDPSTSFAGQTVIVTGSNIGLGFSAAQQIAQRGASRIILAVRTVSKGETAAQQIRSSLPPSNSAAQIEAWPLDLSSYQSVKEFAARANQLDRLDLLLENAGVAMMGFELQEGDEATITTNVISTTLLAVLLLPKLRETAKKFDVVPHLTIVSSEVAFHSTFEERKAENIFERLADPKGGMAGRYVTRFSLPIFFYLPSLFDSSLIYRFLDPAGTKSLNSYRTSSSANSQNASLLTAAPSSSSTPSTQASANPHSVETSPVPASRSSSSSWKRSCSARPQWVRGRSFMVRRLGRRPMGSF